MYMDLGSKINALDNVLNAIVNLDLDSISILCRNAVELDIGIQDIVNTVARAMEVVGRKYEEGEYFLSELIVAGECVKECFKVLDPLFRESSVFIGRAVVGTVEGDLHDIGKNLFIMFLRSMGFEVIDLGVDVPPQKFVEAIKQYSPDIVGMSALLTTTIVNMKEVIKALEEVGLRDRVKIIVGGAAVTKEFAKEIGADAGGVDAYEGALICKKWIEERKLLEGF